MFKLFKNAEIFSPEPTGTYDLLVARDKIYKIAKSIDSVMLTEFCSALDAKLETYDCTGKILCPGFIDQHVHLTGGGGEKGPDSRTPEITFQDLNSCGTTTVAGLLGADSLTRTISDLYTKARALESEGMTTYIYSGSYGVPAATLTRKCVSDITFIDKVLGIGEIAISDYRSSHPTLQQMQELAWEATIGGMLANKPGVLHIHVGDGKSGIQLLFDLAEQSDFSVAMLVPTHMNRNRKVFEQAKRWLEMGGNVDLTSGPATGDGLTIDSALAEFLAAGKTLERVTCSSDGNGSSGDSICKPSDLFADIRKCIIDKNMPVEAVISTVTANVAKILQIYPQKGAVKPGSDADLLLIEKDTFNIDKVFLKGRKTADNGENNKKPL